MSRFGGLVWTPARLEMLREAYAHGRMRDTEGLRSRLNSLPGYPVATVRAIESQASRRGFTTGRVRSPERIARDVAEAIRLRGLGKPWREIARLIGVHEKTLQTDVRRAELAATLAAEEVAIEARRAPPVCAALLCGARATHGRWCASHVHREGRV